MKEAEQERRDWIIVIIVLLVGLLCVSLAGGWALRFSPNWKLDADMGSNLDPDSGNLASRPGGPVQAISASILTQPVWLNTFLTPGTAVPTRIHVTSTSAPLATSTSLPSVATEFITPTATNTLIYLPPASTPTSYPTNTKTPKTKSAPTATSIPATLTNTPVTPTPSADLQITNTDNAANYAAGISVQYVIVVSNPLGPNGVNGAVVSDTFSSNLTGIAWTCIGSGGASCTASGSGNINDSAVNLPVGSSVAYTVNAAVVGSPSGLLLNTATVNIPGASGTIDPNTSNNSATDTDSLIVANPIPSGSIGNLPTGSYSDYQFSTPLTVGSGSYLIYYPQYSAPSPTLQMDLVILQISDGKNWYTIFTWGDGAPDTNTDINPADCPSESDNCSITLPTTNSPGITINMNGVVPNGTYPYIRIISPSDSGDGVDVNTITVVP